MVSVVSTLHVVRQVGNGDWRDRAAVVKRGESELYYLFWFEYLHLTTDWLFWVAINNHDPI